MKTNGFVQEICESNTEAGRFSRKNDAQQQETLQIIAKPYAAFEPIGETVSTWEVGSCEGNEHVPVWNHDIQLIEKDETHTQYTDRVEIHAGWKTVFIWLWANAFYAHRQRKWIRLLKQEEA